MHPLDESRAVQIAIAPNEAIGLMWKDVLEEEGIVVMLKPGGVGFALGQASLSEYFVFVRDDQAEQARELLSDFLADDETGDVDEEAWAEP
jgi:hypothetical protein